MAQAGGVSRNKIILGTHTTLSGPNASLAKSVVMGMRIAFVEINAKGGIFGRKIRLIAEDHGTDKNGAIKAINKLITQRKVFAVVGAFGARANALALPVQMRSKIPNLFPFTGTRSISEPFHRLQFSSQSTYYDQIRAGIKYFVGHRGKKRICDLYRNTEFGREVHSAALDQLSSAGLALAATKAYEPEKPGFATAIESLKNAGCQVIILGSGKTDTVAPVVAAKNIGWQPLWVGSTAIMDAAISRAKRGVTQGVFAVAPYEIIYPDDTRPKVAAFIRAYKKRTGGHPDPAAQFGYIAAGLTIRGLINAGPKLTVVRFIRGLEKIKNYQDIFDGSPLSFSRKKHHGSKSGFLMRIENGLWFRKTDHLNYQKK